MIHPLDDARAKLEQARHHLERLKQEAALVGDERDLHRILVEYDADEGRYVIYSKMSGDPFPNLSLRLGDLVHCARGALDFSVWQLAIRHLGREPSEREAPNIQFPITADRNAFRRARLWRYVSDDAKAALLEVQPHPENSHTNGSLALLKWISNRDKHRLVIPQAMLIDVAPMPRFTFDPELPPGTTMSMPVPMSGPKSTDPSEVYYRGDPTTVRFGWLELDPLPPANTTVELSPQLPLEVIFPGPDGYFHHSGIEAVVHKVDGIVGQFQRFFE